MVSLRLKFTLVFVFLRAAVLNQTSARQEQNKPLLTLTLRCALCAGEVFQFGKTCKNCSCSPASQGPGLLRKAIAELPVYMVNCWAVCPASWPGLPEQFKFLFASSWLLTQPLKAALSSCFSAAVGLDSSYPEIASLGTLGLSSSTKGLGAAWGAPHKPKLSSSSSFLSDMHLEM